MLTCTRPKSPFEATCYKLRQGNTSHQIASIHKAKSLLMMSFNSGGQSLFSALFQLHILLPPGLLCLGQWPSQYCKLRLSLSSPACILRLGCVNPLVQVSGHTFHLGIWFPAYKPSFEQEFLACLHKVTKQRPCDAVGELTWVFCVCVFKCCGLARVTTDFSFIQ